jgi:hypothetical protein
MTAMIPINYRDFWDVPRIFVTSYQGQQFLFDCPFNETAEDYPDRYAVYLMPSLTEDDLQGSWAVLPAKATRRLGTVPVIEIRFDATRRQAIDATVLDEILAAPSRR